MIHLHRLRISLVARIAVRRWRPLREQLLRELPGILTDLGDEAWLLLEELSHRKRNEEQLSTQLTLDAYRDRFGSELNALSAEEDVFEETARVRGRAEVRGLRSRSKPFER